MNAGVAVLSLLSAAMIVACGCAGHGPRPAQPPPAPLAGGDLTPLPVPSAAPRRDPALDALPLVAEIHVGSSDHIFQGGDDHVSIGVTNRGRDILHFVIRSPLWVEQHGLAMGSSRQCMPDLAAGLIDCGPVYAGQDVNFQLRAMPSDVGRWEYRAEFLDRAPDGTLIPIGMPNAPAVPVVVLLHEEVTPVGLQIPGYRPEPTASPTR